MGSRPADAGTQDPPYYAVIFTSVRTDVDDAGYAEASRRMEELAARQPGFLGIESVREAGIGITVSYWSSEEAVAAWREHPEHLEVQAAARERWYDSYSVHVARVDRAYAFERS